MRQSNPFERFHPTATRPAELEALSAAQREARLRGFLDTSIALLVMVGLPSALIASLVLMMRSGW